MPSHRGLLEAVLVILPAFAWLFLATTIVSGTYPMDSDTEFLLEQSFWPLAWTERFEIWATTPHPFGVLVQMGYLQLVVKTGLSAMTAWTVLILFSLLAFFSLVLAWALENLRKYSGDFKRDVATVAIFIALCLLPFAPSVYYVFASREEDAIGVTLFALFIAIMARSRQPPTGLYSVLAWGLSITLLWAWHMQYGAILSFAAMGAGSMVLLRHLLKKSSGQSTSSNARSLIAVGLIPAITHVLLHATGIVRYVSYHEQFTSVFSFVAQGEPITDYLRVVGAGSAAAFGQNTLMPFVIWFALAIVFFLVSLCLVSIFFVPANLQFLLWILLASLAWPMLYEPNSLERWTAATISIFLLLPSAIRLSQSRLEEVNGRNSESSLLG